MVSTTTMAHNLGPECRLAPVAHADKENGMPPIEAQYFYSSLIPIDDPLSATAVANPSDARSGKTPLRPFGPGDNIALEKAWLGLQSEQDRKTHGDIKSGRERVSEAAKASSEKRPLLVQTLALKHWENHRTGFQRQELALPVVSPLSGPSDTVCCSELVVDISEELHSNICALERTVNPELEPDRLVQDITAVLARYRQLATKLKEDSNIQTTDVDGSSPSTPRNANFKFDGRHDTTQNKTQFDAVRYIEGRARSGSQASNRSVKSQTPAGIPIPRPDRVDDGITGKPFVRVGSAGTPVSGSLPRAGSPAPQSSLAQIPDHVEVLNDPQVEAQKLADAMKEKSYRRESAQVAVGVSKLHMVTLPALQMKPIYWSPVNDLASVTRATWFYRDTMLPVPSAVANQLEAGYHDLRPWSQTWRDEVKCAIYVGSSGEEKLSHELWPKGTSLKGSGKNLAELPAILTDPFCAARCFQGDAAAEGSIEYIKPGKEDAEPRIPFLGYHVLYKNDREAFMLKQSLKPSAYYGRRPLAKILKGITVGIPVVRGFDRKKWERVHVKKEVPNETGTSAANQSHESHGEDICSACKADKERDQVMDLVLVAHGIGQKFAERVESYHFTHAINGFRRAVNIELRNPIVQQVMKQGQNGLMILPLNWRMGLSFEDGGPMREEDMDEYTSDGFGLKDIEPRTIPAIRSMISDVMFDIPFYMSHHKGKMIKALVSEANRVYRLWCRNNPGFAENGRVHLIGHSLGSAMALDILSRQPTYVPPLNFSQELETRHFEFDTKNLFLAGSPAGFFLLLERRVLVPRRGRHKPGADPVDIEAKNIVGEVGTFGCLAVDNIYNILAKEDPIAYLLNGAVDAGYASSLKVAHVPSTATPFLTSLRNAIPGLSAAPPLSADLSVDRPPPVRLPSQLELEVHDFTREEIAEKKAYLLNDNGQIDFYLRSGGGPLEIQYLNMLSAHSSYWTNSDFIRMLCVEIGREEGREGTLPGMRAVKKGGRMVPK